MKKSEVKDRESIFAEFKRKDEEVRSRFETEERKINQKAAELQKDLERLEGELSEKRKAIAKDHKDYLKMVAAHEKETEKKLKENVDLLQRGRRSEVLPATVQRKYKHPDSIRAAAREEFRDKTGQIREILRSKQTDILRLKLKIGEARFRLRQLRAGRFEAYLGSLEFRLKELRKFQAAPYALDNMRRDIEKLKIDITMAEKGGYPEPRTFDIRSIDEFELLVTDPRIREQDFQELETKADELRGGFDWDESFLKVVYRPGPCDAGGSEGFDFRVISRPGQPKRVISTQDLGG